MKAVRRYCPLKTNCEAVQSSGLLHVDETSWRELNTLLWLWVFWRQGVVVYWIASRGSELLINVLGSAFQGWLMSDGWQFTVITSNAFVAGRT